jgi:tight adherence protein B
MAGAGISAARAAASAYARELPSDVRVGLITFANRPTVLLQPTTDRNALAIALGKVQAGGYTSLYDGITAAVNLMRGLPADAQRRLLVLSDGADTRSKTSLAGAISSLQSAHVAADVVAFRLPGSQSVLSQIASGSHGTVLPASDAGGLARAFVAAAQVFGQRMAVTVKVPANLDHKSVTLAVTVRAGSQTVTAQVPATLTAASHPQSNPAGGGPAAAPVTTRLSDPGLLAVLALAFVGMLAVALLLLLGPVVRHDRASWQARIAEASRYRVVRSVGNESDGSAGVEAPTEGAFAKRALSVVDRAVRARGRREKMVSELERAGLRMRPEEWAVLQVAAVLAFAAFAFVLSRSIIGVIVGAVLGWLACRVFVRVKISRRVKAFEEQLADNLQLLGGSLRSGFSLAQALGTVVREGTEPTASEFTRALTEVRLGSTLEDALDRTAERMKSEDLRWVVMAIRISREVGGNLAEVLDKTVETIRERARLRGQVQVLTAEGRLSARILTGLPIFVGAIFILIRPAYVHPLFHSFIGLIMLSIGIAELLLGAFWLNRLTKIEV